MNLFILGINKVHGVTVTFDNFGYYDKLIKYYASVKTEL